MSCGVESECAMDRREFERLVVQTLERLPRKFRERIRNVAIIVEDSSPRGREGVLLGLFRGIPETERSIFQASPPSRIILYQKNIERICSNQEQVRRELRKTLLHELGHYFGLTEGELRLL
jgi:predicted Zn-dependent protease with MMP-like domain